MEIADEQNNKRVSPPKWLGPVGTRYYIKVVRNHRHITDTESIGILADCYETWRTAREDLQDFMTANDGSCLLNGKEHPAISIAERAHSQFEKITKRLKLWQTPEAIKEEEKVKSLALDLEDDDED
jgi:Phage terminase, small subunit.